VFIVLGGCKSVSYLNRVLIYIEYIAHGNLCVILQLSMSLHGVVLSSSSSPSESHPCPIFVPAVDITATGSTLNVSRDLASLP
jgi:hypothetical protein